MDLSIAIIGVPVVVGIIGWSLSNTHRSSHDNDCEFNANDLDGFKRTEEAIRKRVLSSTK